MESIRYINQKIYLIIIIVLSFLLSGNALTNIFSLSTTLLLFLFSLVFMHVLAGILKLNKGTIYLWLLLIMVYMPVLYSIKNIRYSFFVGMIIICAFGVTEVMSREKFNFYFIKFMVFISWISLIGYLIVNFTNITFPFKYYISPASNTGYGVGFLFNYLINEPKRNIGIFWEPGLMSGFVAYAILIDSMFIGKLSRINKMILLLTILTTGSSTGYVIFFLILELFLIKYFLDFKKDSRLYYVYLWLVLVIVFFTIFLFLNLDSVISNIPFFHNNRMLTKLLSTNLENTSRIKSITMWIEEFLSAPITGVGIQGIVADYIWDTSTNFLMLGSFGILGLIYTMMLIRGVFSLDSKPILIKILYLLIILIILNTQPHYKMLISWIYLFYLNFPTSNLERGT